jgi:hypothetical protein
MRGSKPDGDARSQRPCDNVAGLRSDRPPRVCDPRARGTRIERPHFFAGEVAPFSDGADAFVFGLSFLGFLASRFPRCSPLGMTGTPVAPRECSARFIACRRAALRPVPGDATLGDIFSKRNACRMRRCTSREANMVDDITRASDALRLAAADANFRPLIPALSSCPTCGTVIMVAAPVLTTCLDCGLVSVVLDRTSVAVSAAHDHSVAA